MKTPIVIALVSALVLPALASADHGVGRCGPGDNLALGRLEIGTGDPSATFYIDDRNLPLGNGLWVYQESNGVYTAGASVHDNNQRGGASPYIPDDSEICTDKGDYDPDTLII